MSRVSDTRHLPTSYIPEVMGLEEESRASINCLPLTESEVAKVVWGMQQASGGHNSTFTYNGGRVYNDSRGPEFATPECDSPEQLAVYSRANYQTFLDKLAWVALRASEELRCPVRLRTHRRTVFGHGESVGLHHNFPGTESLGNALAPPSSGRALYLAHAAARSLIVGAGRVTDDHLYFSQKRSVPYNDKDIEARGFKPTVFKWRADQGRESRFESRDNDINPSDWVLQVGLAGTAMFLALIQTPLANRLHPGMLARIKPGPSARVNQLRLQPDGTISPTGVHMAAIDYEQRIADLMLNEYGKYAEELGPKYRMLMEEQYTYCDDFRAVVHGDRTIRDLSGRSDWATKFSLILLGVQRDEAADKPRSLHDDASKATDLMYDAHVIYADASKNDSDDMITIHRSHAEKLRERGKYALQVSEGAVQRAVRTPPSSTRAHERVELIRKGGAGIGQWDKVTVNDVVYTLDKLTGGNTLK